MARALLDALALPDPPSVVHVVGTNGKGSVATLLAAMVSASGRRSGRFMSPHVERFDERIAIDGVPIAPDLVIALAAEARRLLDAGVAAAERAGFFEWTLALALRAFADARVEVAVVEAGVGARRDATLALGNVIGAVITNVDLDHVETLGPDLASIARDKAAAIRAGVPVVTGAGGEALAIVREAARELSAPLLALGDRAGGGDMPSTLPAALLARARSERWPATRLENLRLAFALGRLLGWPESALLAAADAPPPPARFERFEVAGVRVVLDGAHDPAAARRLALELPADTVLLFGALLRKQGGATLAALAPHVARVVLTRVDPAEPIGPWPADERVDDPEDALRVALSRARPGGTVAIAGSLYLAGRLRRTLREATAAAQLAR